MSPSHCFSSARLTFTGALVSASPCPGIVLFALSFGAAFATKFSAVLAHTQVSAIALVRIYARIGVET